MSDGDRIPEPPEDEPGPLSSFERMVFTGPPPASPRLMQLGEEIVAATVLRFKNFREDLERAEGRAIERMKAGEISQEDAQLLFLDSSQSVSKPLVKRYLEKREYELIYRFLHFRIMYHPTGWLTERNRMAVDTMLADGEDGLAIGLLREFLKKLYQHTQEKWRAAGRKPPKSMSDPVVIEQMAQARDDALLELPSHLEIAEMELAEIEFYISEHGSREDNRAIEKFREEIAKARKRFGLDT
ncbi:hypothetical protein [Altererythrobacter sp. MF3-039]|uniref:hypothetical protein n=1 Tax=Altererythrobacter sp. MF3-039 TaxID=3252901 RepID=UPI00390C4A7F